MECDYALRAEQQLKSNVEEVMYSNNLSVLLFNGYENLTKM